MEHKKLTDMTPATHRSLAVELFNHTWSLIDRPVRSAVEDDEMLHAAHASRHHWSHAAGAAPANLAVGEWQLSRVYAVLKRAEPALHHGRRALELAEQHDLGHFQLGCAHEAMARAYSLAGDRDSFDRARAQARHEQAQIADPEDATVLAGDLATLVRP